MASEQFSLCWDNFHKNMSSGMNSLLESGDLVDVTLAVEGKFLKAHKMVLSVCSPYFKELFKTNPCQHPIVFMKDVSYVAISDLLQFMYQGEVQVSQDNLTTFIKTAEALQIKGLTGDGNGSTDADSEPVQEKPTRHIDESYKPSPRPKKQLPAPVVTTTPAVKRPRLSASSNDSQSAPIAIAKTEPSSTGVDSSSVQFKVEPYDLNQSVTIPDDGDDNFDENLDDNTVDDTEDYSMMEGEEPQAGTSTDGTGEGQASNQKPDVSLKAVLRNQKLMMHRQLKLQRSVDALTSYMFDYYNNPPMDSSSLTPVPVCEESASSKISSPIEPIDSLEKLTQFEEKLKDETYLAQVIESMSFICGKSGKAMGLDCCYKLIDYFLTRRFVAQCSWTGNTRMGPGVGKVPLKFFHNFRKCFRDIITLADSKFTETESEDFFKRVMRNSVKRVSAGQMRQSRHKNRPKNLKYNHVQWKRTHNEEEKQFDELVESEKDGNGESSQSYIKVDLDFDEEEGLV
ncbi:uncharacterized protein [Euwallacea similis]|uniref:uncharacterized protein isoform X9 n=1 Tax=Euwallacea similis TaxID=1736056 RepID=UPI00344C2641